MKRLFCFILLVIFVVPAIAGVPKMITRVNRITHQVITTPIVNVHELQYVSPDSLTVADAIQDVAARQNIQYGPYSVGANTATAGDTITVIGTVVAPAHVLSYTAKGWTMLLHDTTIHNVSDPNVFGGILVREETGVNGYPSGYPDTVAAQADGFENPAYGDIILITGICNEFPASTMLSTTQFQPLYGFPVEIVGSGAIPAPTPLLASDLMHGDPNAGGTVNYSMGEKYESSLIQLTSLTVTSYIKFTRGTWAMVDQYGNIIADYDASHYWTKGNENPVIPGDTSFHLPPLGAVIDTIRGTVQTVAGGKGSYGYQICPIYPGDVKFGVTLPGISTHRRTPVVVTSNDTVVITCVAKRQPGGYDLGKVVLYKSYNYGAWVADTMDAINDTTFQDILLDPDGNPLINNTNVRYFMKAFDVDGRFNTLANSNPNTQYDTTRGFFLYTVHDGPFSIHDVQYNPYPSGRSPYVGGYVTISGTVTADTSDMVITQIVQGSPAYSYGTSAWYVQSGNAPWSGIWVVSNDTASRAALAGLVKGDSVILSGWVGEYNTQSVFDVTRLVDSLVTVVAHNRPVPQPVTLTTGRFKSTVSNGNPNAEPYESMLIRIVNAHVAVDTPTFSWKQEYAIDDGTGQMLVLQDGHNHYSNLPSDSIFGKTKFFKIGDQLDTLVGIVFGSYGRWKMVPRTDADFVTRNATYRKGWNMVSLGMNFDPPLNGNDPAVVFSGAISRAFAYEGSYKSKTVLSNGIGYWLKFSDAVTYERFGSIRTKDTCYLVPGWNMIGSIGNNVLVNSLGGVYPPTQTLSKFFGYTTSYQVADTLKPHRGYWVKASEAGYIVLGVTGPGLLPLASTVTTDQFNTVTITDRTGNSQVLYVAEDLDGKLRPADYELPPSGPEASSFDVRFSSGRVLEACQPAVKKGYEFPITVTAENGPLTVSWNIRDNHGRHYLLSSEAKGTSLKSKELVEKGSVTIPETGTFQMKLAVSGATAPRQFSLSDNYPNPFNPTTHFNVGVASLSHVDIIVYNILGQKVATVLDGVRDAGYYTVTWNGLTNDGTPAATGMYIVRMNVHQTEGGPAAQFTAVRKVMMMK